MFINKLQFHNFFEKKLYIPLIGALSEILESLNKIKVEKEKEELKKYLLDDKIFFILYIMLLNSIAPENIKNTFKSLFISQNYLNMESNFQDIIFDLDKMNNNDISFYGFSLFYFLEFLLIYAPNADLKPIYNLFI